MTRGLEEGDAVVVERLRPDGALALRPDNVDFAVERQQAGWQLIAVRKMDANGTKIPVESLELGHTLGRLPAACQNRLRSSEGRGRRPRGLCAALAG